VAKILAMQYWEGTRDRHGVGMMAFEEYMGKSIENWMGSARGVIHLVRMLDKGKTK
jgi:hypothetical protein